MIEDNPMFPLRVIAGLAVLSCLMMIFSHYRNDKLNKTVSNVLILNMNIAILIENIVVCFLPTGAIVNNFTVVKVKRALEIRVTCVIQAYLSIYGNVASMLWSCSMMYVLLRITISKKVLGYNPEDDMKAIKVVCLVTPLLIGLIPACFREFSSLAYVFIINGPGR